MRRSAVNVVRAGLDAHTITRLARVPTYTLLLIGPHRGTWGFLEPVTTIERHGEKDYETGDRSTTGRFLGVVYAREGYGPSWWRWTRHDRFPSGHYAPERATNRR